MQVHTHIVYHPCANPDVQNHSWLNVMDKQCFLLLKGEVSIEDPTVRYQGTFPLLSSPTV